MPPHGWCCSARASARLSPPSPSSDPSPEEGRRRAARPIYTAPTIEAAESELLAFADSALGRRYPATVAT